MRLVSRRRLAVAVRTMSCVGLACGVSPANEAGRTASEEVLTAAEWEQVRRSTDRGLAWLAAQEGADGSFPTLRNGQPGVTSLGLLAFLAYGHTPGEGPYGDRLNRAVEYVLSQQKPSGLVATMAPNQTRLDRRVHGSVGTSVAYNHAISSLALSEAYGVLNGPNAERVAESIRRALKPSLEMQRWATRAADRGGWRYMHRHNQYESDLSITGCELMFLRSAKNAGFDVPQQPINDAVAYVRRCFNREYGTFEYEVSPRDRRSRGMAGAGVLALAHAGFHNSAEAQAAGEWILRHDFNDYNTLARFSRGNTKDRYHYGVFNCSQAMYQLGGKYWEGFFPGAAAALVDGQRANGSWPPEVNDHETRFGSTYTTALALMALGAPNQMLPVFQR